MPFITQGKTNWKFLLIVIILTALVIVFSWWLSKNIFIEGPLIKPPETDEKYCEKDEDCVFIDFQCCPEPDPCQREPPEVVNRDHKEKIEKDLESKCSPICPPYAPPMCSDCLNLEDFSPACINNRCTSKREVNCENYCEALAKDKSKPCPWISNEGLITEENTEKCDCETADWEIYQSPDGFLIAQIIPMGVTKENKVQIRTNEDALLQEADYSSEDGEHGLTVAHAEWTPNSQFFIYSAYSSGGHQPYFSRVYFYSRFDNKIYDFREVSEFTVARDEFTTAAPDIVTFTVYASVVMGPTTTKSFKLSEIISTLEWKTYRNEEYGFEIKYPEGMSPEHGPLNEPNVFYFGGPPYELSIVLTIFDISEREKYPSPSKYTKVTEIIVGGEKGIRYENEYKTSGYWERGVYIEPHMRLEITIEAEHKENIYKFHINRSAEYENVFREFDQMLSTFKFINPVAEYFEGAELQYEGEIQKENIANALKDILNLSEEELKERRYRDYTGKENQWDLPTLIYRHFVPKPPGTTLGDNFFHDVKSDEVREQVREILDNYFK